MVCGMAQGPADDTESMGGRRRKMTGSQDSNEADPPAASEANGQDLEWLFGAAPGVREAIQQRVADNPDYRSWLQNFGRSVLRAVEQPEAKALLTFSPNIR